MRIRSACVLLVATSTLGCEELARRSVDQFDSHETNVWTAASDCETLLAEQPPTGTVPRLGTWNVRFFPDAQEEHQPDEEHRTHVEWLACTIASLDVDVLAIQEFKNTPEAREKQQQLIAGLNDRTGGDWKIELAPCTPDEVQHPGFLYDANRATGSNFREIPILNPKPVCSNDVSPGFGGYFELAHGPDLHLISVHMSSGNGESSFLDRSAAVAAMQQVVTDAQALVPDPDVVFTGDFNTSGCEDCDPIVSSEEEIASLSDEVTQLSPPMSVLPATEECSRQDDDGSQLLDHFAVGLSQELPEDSRAHVSGICEAMGCGRLKAWYEDAHDRLSDHCPVLLDLAALDDD
jgi:endonuclease/exonuclease/phosphatase family metal-dependent hydrolase